MKEIERNSKREVRKEEKRECERERNREGIEGSAEIERDVISEQTCVGLIEVRTFI